MTTRPPAVAGSFYPANSAVLTSMIDDFLAAARKQVTPAATKALISPHAGYVYSGSTAALGFASLVDPASITRVVVACPTHRVGIRGIALPGVDALATPLGEIPVDQDALGALEEFPLVVARPDVHAQEHALEVQLPFLQRVLGEFALVPLAVGEVAPDRVAEVLAAIWGGPETLVLISSDLSHYHPYARARELDAATIKAILACRTPIDDHRACGVRPLNGFLELAAARGLRPRLLGACNSGDTAGNRGRVVGYASIGWEEDHDAA